MIAAGGFAIAVIWAGLVLVATVRLAGAAPLGAPGRKASR